MTRGVHTAGFSPFWMFFFPFFYSWPACLKVVSEAARARARARACVRGFTESLARSAFSQRSLAVFGSTVYIVISILITNNAAVGPNLAVLGNDTVGFMLGKGRRCV